MKRLIIIFFMILLSGCANQEPLKKKTQSGKPEGTYQNTTKSDVKDSLSEYCNNKGLIVMESTDSIVICSKETEGMHSILSQMVLGNSYSTTPVAKIKFSIGEVGGSVKVWSDAWIETQMAMGQIKQMVIKDNSTINDLQNILDNLKPKKK
ncbi:MAG TPA: hypothetical protein ACHBZ9_06860 [Arsenophonus nasoniae]|uniref:hypothetical protein n=1 Tax=Arsenophonus nasoniae TaxID=638 RepID=UPI003879A1D6